MKQYEALAGYIKQKYGKGVYVVWYGQFDKKHYLDFDDILASGKTKYLLISFAAFVRKHKEFKVLQKKKRFTANHKFSAKYIPVNDHLWGKEKNPLTTFARNIGKKIRSILAIKSPMGTGKTEALKKMLELLNCGIFLIGYRHSLLWQTVERVPDIYHISQTVNRSQFAAKKESIALCVDSIWKIQVEDVQDKVLVLDEAPLVIEHLLTSDTCKGKRHKLITHLLELLKNCAGVVIMSDQLTDRDVELVRKASEIENELLVENTYQIMPARKVTVYDNEKHLKQTLNEAIAEGKKILLTTDSQKFTDTWNRKTTEEINTDCKTLVINSGTLYRKEVQDFLKSPNKYLDLYEFVLVNVSTLITNLWRFDMPSAKPFFKVYTESELKEKLKHYCGLCGTNQSEVINMLVDGWVNEIEKAAPIRDNFSFSEALATDPIGE